MSNLALLSFNTGRGSEAQELAAKSGLVRMAILSHMLAFTSEQQRLAYHQTINPYSLPATLGTAPAIALTLLRFKGVVLDSLLEDRLVIQASRTAEDLGLLDELMRSKQRLVQWLLETPKDISPAALERRATERKQLTTKVEDLEKDMARRVAGLGRPRRALSVTVEQVQRAIPSQAVLLELVGYWHYLGTDQRERRYGAIVLGPAGDPRWVQLGRVEAIEKNIGHFQAAVRAADPAEKPGRGQRQEAQAELRNPQTKIQHPKSEASFAALLQALYQQLWAPIEEALPVGTTTVIISPDRELNFVSFATLLTPEDKFLSQKYSISYVASGRDLLIEKRRVVANQICLYGNPDFTGRGVIAHTNAPESFLLAQNLERRDLRGLQLLPLPGTAKETAAVAAQAQRWRWLTKVFLGPDASEAQLRTMTPPRILHLATHGFFLGDRGEGAALKGRRDIGGEQPMVECSRSNESANLLKPRMQLRNPMHRSGLALAGAQATLEAWKRGNIPPTEHDGIITADEVGGLRLEGTELVVLSACDTGVGEVRSSEGILGLGGR